jgi:hypothetical protein
MEATIHPNCNITDATGVMEGLGLAWTVGKLTFERARNPWLYFSLPTCANLQNDEPLIYLYVVRSLCTLTILLAFLSSLCRFQGPSRSKRAVPTLHLDLQRSRSSSLAPARRMTQNHSPTEIHSMNKKFSNLFVSTHHDQHNTAMDHPSRPRKIAD